jgi:hypothetical protein
MKNDATTIADYWDLLAEIFFSVVVNTGPGKGLWFRVSPVKREFFDQLPGCPLAAWTHLQEDGEVLTVDFGQPREDVVDAVIREITERIKRRGGGM